MKKALILVSFILLFYFPPQALAEHGEAGQPLPLLRWGAGARGFAMGGAQIASVDDASAVFWNPAGLPGLSQGCFSIFRAELFCGLGVDFAALSGKIGENQGAGIGWMGFHTEVSTDYGPQTVRQNIFYLSYGFKWRNLSLGATGKYFFHNLGEDFTAAYSLDLGAEIGLGRSLAIACVVQDFNEPVLNWTTGHTEIVPVNIKYGLSWQKDKFLTLEINWENHDLRERWHLGAEWTVFPAVKLRAGIEGDSLTGMWSQGEYSLGIGIDAGINWSLDYAYLPHELGSTQRISLNYHF